MSQPTISDLIVWQPNAGQQTYVLQRVESEILYGGARGGGKTDACIAWVTRWVDNPDLRFLVIRRNASDLIDWIDRAKKMWTSLGAVFVGREVRFPSGAKGRFGHLYDDNAYERYQGHEYQKIMIEELTHIPTEELYLKLLGSNRSTVKGLTAQMFATTNPGNAGHKWVKKRWNTGIKSQHNVPFVDEHGNSRIFVPAKVSDNPVLVEADPAYVRYLDGLPDALRKAWRDGSWESFDVKGAYYSKWIEEARQKKRITSVSHETSLPVHTWWDLGMSDATTIGFFQLAGRNEWRMIDYYECEGEGIQHYISILEDKRRELGYNYGEHHAPHDIEVREFTRDGKTRRQIAKELGIDFTVVPNQRLEDGIQAVRTRFNIVWFDAVKCEDFLDKLGQYRKGYDEKNVTFKDKPVHDWTSHAADMFRYWAVTPFTGGSRVAVKNH